MRFRQSKRMHRYFMCGIGTMWRDACCEGVRELVTGKKPEREPTTRARSQKQKDCFHVWRSSLQGRRWCPNGIELFWKFLWELNSPYDHDGVSFLVPNEVWCSGKWMHWIDREEKLREMSQVTYFYLILPADVPPSPAEGGLLYEVCFFFF